MKTLMEIIEAVEWEVSSIVEFDPDLDDTWDDWFASNARRFRFFTGVMIMESGEGRYAGGVGDHALELGSVFVLSEDGYRGLLVQWLAAARAQLEPQAVPA